MKTIHKYPLSVTQFQEIAVPFGGIPIHAGLDPSENPCIWCEVETDNLPEPLPVFLLGTGHERPERARQHVGSYVQGPFVWHVYTS